MSYGSQEILTFDEFCTLYKEVLAHNGLSMHLLRSLHRKLEHEIFDAGDYFLLTPDEKKEGAFKAVVSCDDGVDVSDSNSVFLIDHAWTYEANGARKQLCESPGLLPRIAQMLGYSVHGEVFSPDDDVVNNILKDMWKYNQTYSIAQKTAEPNVPLWYFMDEFGSCIQHSDSPTVLVVPFFYQPKQISFSIMWPIVSLDYGDEVTRDYANFEKDPILRKCKLFPWIPADMSDVSSKAELFADKRYEDRYKYSNERLPAICSARCSENERLKVYMDVFGECLTDVASFEVIEEMSEADVIFTKEPIKDFKKFGDERPEVFLNQFPGEALLFCKDFFVDIARRCTEDGRVPAWCPVSFDLHSQFPQFVSHFVKRSSKGIWITKPWNLPRNVDVNVSNNLSEIIRQRETGRPKVVSKYTENPVLFARDGAEGLVKFDLRFYVLVTSIRPLKTHVCEIFSTRFASKPFSLDRLDDEAVHFTGEHDSDEAASFHGAPYTDFVENFEKQNRGVRFRDLRADIYKCISEFMKSATSRLSPYGVGQYPNSRAIYGFDVALEWEVDEHTGSHFINPTLLECKFMPPLHAVCKNYPSFLNDVFRFLFMGDEGCQAYDISDL